MTSLHERLCTWVQVHHLYQPARKSFLDVYLKHHLAHCRYCQQEIEAIDDLGASIGALDFDIASTPTDATWARLSATLPPRELSPCGTESESFTPRRPMYVRNIAFAALACAGVVFGTMYFRVSRYPAPVQKDEVAAAEIVPQPQLSPANTSDSALASTREQAAKIAIIDDNPSDPFAKAGEPETKAVLLPPTLVRRPIPNRQSGGKKPLIVASTAAKEVDVNVTAVTPIPSANQLQTPPLTAMRASNEVVQNDQLLGVANASRQSDTGTAAATYMPSAAMELTESQNRLRSLLQ